MKKILLLLGLIIGCFIPSVVYSVPRNKAADFVISGKEIWLLQPNDKLKVYDYKTGKIVDKNLEPIINITLLTKDYYGAIVIVDDHKNVKRLNKRNFSWENLFTSKSKLIFDVMFNSNNGCFLITNEGIISVNTLAKWFPVIRDKYSRRYNFYDWEALSDNPISFIDNQDNIWINTDHGEFGSDICVFNTRLCSFQEIDNIIDKATPFNNICCVNQSILISAGWLFGGKIVSINQKIGEQLKGKVIYDTEYNNIRSKSSQDYLGKIAYNNVDSCLYMACTAGLYKANIYKDISSIQKWDKVNNFILAENDRRKITYMSVTKNEKIALDADYLETMNVAKMQFTPDQKIVLLSSDNYKIYLFDFKNLICLN